MLKSPYLKRKIFWAKDYLNGGNLWRAYSSLKSLEKKSNRDEEVQKILKYASEVVPFYKGMGNFGLKDFPVVNKTIYTQNYEKFLAPKELIPGQNGNIHVQKTSGSTGTPFAVPQDTNCRLKRIASIKIENEKFGFQSCDPMLQLRSFSHYWGGGQSSYNQLNNIWYYNNSDLNEEKIISIINLINRKRIKFIRGYLTSLDIVTGFAEENKIDFKHKPLFISGGELLTPKVRDRVVDRLGCSIVSQYANEENGVFGTSPLNGSGKEINLHNRGNIIEILRINSDEPVTNKDEIGRVVVTDFTNYAFPMIRYDIGDLASIGEINHEGMIVKLKNLLGRKSDMIYRTDGSIIDLYNSMPAEIFNHNQIKQWQFIQTDKTGYLLKIKLKEADKDIQLQNAVNDIKKLLGENAELTVEKVEDIPVLTSGKFRPVLNIWKKY